ncbi:PTS glucose transporter subunit IIA [Xylocopilactobacillus apis]|uniref:PTS sugar transporter subunit IIA n=1 Tax=Xylocopilactobacillus apis TaxID=2932183 RepID=UPI002952AE84|nr:PTS glucose transporter subunit IIA [Xylocopilactobacillus apis]
MIPLNEVKDEAFATASLGEGFAVEPIDGKIVVPCAGKILFIAPSKHAIGIQSDDGLEILIHIGLDTIELNGKYFNSEVTSGDVVKQGQQLMDIDFDKIKEAGYVTQII